MGLRLITDEKLAEMERELTAYKTGMANLEREHDRALAWAREIRDTKDAEIERLHAEIEALKNERGQLRVENNRLRSCIKYYEKERKERERRNAKQEAI